MPADEITTFELKTLTYGTRSAAYYPIKCLQRLVNGDGGDYPVAAKVLQRDLYADDLLTATDNLQEALHLQQQLLLLLTDIVSVEFINGIHHKNDSKYKKLQPS